MADAVTSTTLVNTPQRLVMKFTSISDGTGESAVVKVDKSTFTGPNGLEPTSLRLDKILYSVQGMVVTVKCNRTTDLTLAVLNGFGEMDFSQNGRSQGLQTNTAGDTGDIEFTTTGHSSGDTYDITLFMMKKN